MLLQNISICKALLYPWKWDVIVHHTMVSATTNSIFAPPVITKEGRTDHEGTYSSQLLVLLYYTTYMFPFYCIIFV
jgi:hypothetical protein